MGLLTEVVAPGRHLERALEIAEALARFPQETMLADRRAAIEGFGLPLEEALALEARAGLGGLRGGRRGGRGASPPARAAAARARACSGAPTASGGRPPAAIGFGAHDVGGGMTYFVTGATGFIGRHLVERLLEREGKIHVLVREGSTEKLDELIERWGQPDRIVPVVGDLTEPKLGVSDEQISGRAQGQGRPLLPPRRDLRHDRRRRAQRPAQRRRHAQRGRPRQRDRGGAPSTTSPRSPPPATVQGPLPRGHVRRGPAARHPYHRTKFESEKLARDPAKGPWRVYRPAIVVGHSQTGEMDKIDGPYYFFKAIQKARHYLPEWFPLIGPELGYTNIVPVDYVAAALDHIAHQPGLDGQAFHLTDPKGQRSGEVLNTFARAAHAPQLAMRIDKRLTDALPKGALSMLMKLPALKEVRKAVLADFGIPDEVIEYVGLTAQFDTRDTERALEGSGIEVPPLDTYADKLWDYWERNLDPDLFKDRSFEGAVNGKVVLITGASSGIGKAAAKKIAAAGGIPLLVARSADKLEETKKEIEAAGGTAYTYSADLSDLDSIGSLVARGPRRPPGGRHARQQRGPLDPPLGRAGLRPLPRLRAHDAAQLLRRDQADHGLLPHMRERGRATSSTSPRSARRPTRRASRPTSPRRRRSTRGRASSAPRWSATASRSRRSTCRS